MGESTSETRSAEWRKGGWLPAWITAVLALSAVMVFGFWLVQGLGKRDTEPLESPLILSVARQLVASPSELYGPFGGRNPLVLIHAPLYYRVAALAAWPMTRAGWDPVTAARVAGRSLSVLGLLATLVASYRLARLDDRSRRGVVGSAADRLGAAARGATVRRAPDITGVALQTAGVLLVLTAFQEGPRQRTRAVGLRGVRPGGMRETASDRGSGGEHGPVARGLARVGPVPERSRGAWRRSSRSSRSCTAWSGWSAAAGSGRRRSSLLGTWVASIREAGTTCRSSPGGSSPGPQA